MIKPPKPIAGIKRPRGFSEPNVALPRIRVVKSELDTISQHSDESDKVVKLPPIRQAIPSERARNFSVEFPTIRTFGTLKEEKESESGSQKS